MKSLRKYETNKYQGPTPQSSLIFITRWKWSIWSNFEATCWRTAFSFFLRTNYTTNQAPNQSVIHQLHQTASVLNSDIYTLDFNSSIQRLNASYFIDSELARKSYNLCSLMGDDPQNCAFYRNILNKSLTNFFLTLDCVNFSLYFLIFLSAFFFTIIGKPLSSG